MNAPLQLTGPLTFDQAAGQLAALGALQPGQSLQIDFSQVTAVDSSAVALLLHWQRQAESAQVRLEYLNLPLGLRRLIAVYGLDALLLPSG